MDSQAWPLMISSGRAFFYDGEAPSPEESLDRFWIWHFKKHENGQIREDGRLCRNYGELAEGVFQGEMRVRLVKRTAIFVKSGPIASASPCPSCRFFVSVAALEGSSNDTMILLCSEGRAIVCNQFLPMPFVSFHINNIHYLLTSSVSKPLPTT